MKDKGFFRKPSWSWEEYCRHPGKCKGTVRYLHAWFRSWTYRVPAAISFRKKHLKAVIKNCEFETLSITGIKGKGLVIKNNDIADMDTRGLDK